MHMENGKLVAFTLMKYKHEIIEVSIRLTLSSRLTTIMSALTATSTL